MAIPAAIDAANLTPEQVAGLDGQPNATPTPPPNTGADRSVNMYTPRGEADQFNLGDNGKYRVSNFMYPSDLHMNNSVYGGNYVVFYINVVDDATLNGGRGNLDMNGNPVDTLGVDESIPARDRGQIIATNLQGGRGTGANDELVGTILAQSTGAAVVAGGLNATSATGALTAGALNTGGAFALSSLAPSANRQTKRLRSAIAMHVPNQLQIRYSSQWSEEDTAAFAMAQGVAGGIVNAISNMNGQQAMDPATNAAASTFLSKGVGGGAASVATGLAANPKKEQAFKGVDFRTFTFDYQFFPRSAEESQNVKNIIKQFKYHMHPEMKDERNFLYLYPSEFDIFYYQNGRENLNLHRHTSCVLTDMNINYTPNGVFTTFNDGTPTQINVAMTFKELSILTKEKIRDGL